jgi:hypothetical protein
VRWHVNHQDITLDIRGALDAAKTHLLPLEQRRIMPYVIVAPGWRNGRRIGLKIQTSLLPWKPEKKGNARQVNELRSESS